MKLIIDISEEEYKFIKDLQFYSSGRRNGKTIEKHVINAIKNGTPYNPSGDLISREDLKEKLKERYYNGGLDIVTAIKLIDSATPVPDRPQGEWIPCTKSGMPLTEQGRLSGEKWYGFKCSNPECNYIYKGNALTESPFCQKCGADMRKGGTE